MTAPMGTPVSTLSIGANPLAVRDIGPWLRRLFDGNDPVESDTLVTRLELAVHEVCMNVVDHAGLPPGASLELEGSIDAHRVHIEIRDDGEAFDPNGVPEPVPGVAQVRGYGLMIVRQLVNTVDYRHTDGHNTWVLELDRSAAGPADAPP